MQEIVISTCLRYRKLLFPVFLKRKLLFSPMETVISINGSRYFPKRKPLLPLLLRNVLCSKGLRAILESYNSIIIENKIAIIIDGNLTIVPLFLP